MKLLLCGGGDGEQTVLAYRKFNEIIDNTKPLLYVPLAMQSERYPSCLEWIKNELINVNVPNIEMVVSGEELARKDLNNYSAIFIGGGNTFKLLHDLKISGSFDKLKKFIENDGIVFGSSAGAIIFGRDLDACELDDSNDIGLKDTIGFDVLNGMSILCHYTNGTEEKEKESTDYLIALSNDRKIIALPEEDTIFVNGDSIEVIGTRPYYKFENGIRVEAPIIDELQNCYL